MKDLFATFSSKKVHPSSDGHVSLTLTKDLEAVRKTKKWKSEKMTSVYSFHQYKIGHIKRYILMKKKKKIKEKYTGKSSQVSPETILVFFSVRLFFMFCKDILGYMLRVYLIRFFFSI